MRNLVTPVGRLVFGNLVSPRANPNNDQLEYTAGLVLSIEESEGILANIEQALAEHRVKNPLFPPVNDKLYFPYEVSKKKNEAGELIEEPGSLLWKFKLKAQYRDRNTGEWVNKTPPALYDSLGRVVTGKVDRIPGGSEGKVVYDIFVYDQKSSKGVQLQIRGFQIGKLEQRGIELQPIEGGFIAGEDDIDLIGAALAADA